MHKAILSFDFASSTGWAVANGGKMHYGTLDCRGDDHAAKFWAMYLHTRLLISKHSPHMVYYEDAIHATKSGAARYIMAGMRAAALMAVQEYKNKGYKIEYHPVSITEWKRNLGCNGNAGYMEYIHAVEDKGFPVKTPDDAAAIGVMALALKWHKCDLSQFVACPEKA